MIRTNGRNKRGNFMENRGRSGYVAREIGLSTGMFIGPSARFAGGKRTRRTE